LKVLEVSPSMLLHASTELQAETVSVNGKWRGVIDNCFPETLVKEFESP
jgi:hypothetical protein